MSGDVFIYYIERSRLLVHELCPVLVRGSHPTSLILSTYRAFPALQDGWTTHSILVLVGVPVLATTTCLSWYLDGALL